MKTIMQQLENAGFRVALNGLTVLASDMRTMIDVRAIGGRAFRIVTCGERGRFEDTVTDGPLSAATKALRLAMKARTGK